jgi:Fe-S cluster biosynthesis and repair protein YggX
MTGRGFCRAPARFRAGPVDSHGYPTWVSFTDKGRIDDLSTMTCRVCGQPGETPPEVAWGGSLGEVIRNEVCLSCWAAWEDMSVKIVNEYRLSMSNSEHYKLLVDQLRNYLKLES